MPSLKVPDSLVTASMKTFSYWFLMDSYAGNRRGYFVQSLNCLPVQIYNVVVENIIERMSMCDPPCSKGILLSPILTSVMSEKLTHLDLSCFELRRRYKLFPHFNTAILHVLPSLKNLIYLCLSRFASNSSSFNDNILRSIGKNCNLLKYLNISNNIITDQALVCIIPSDEYGGCPELECLEMLHCNVTASTVAQILEQLPNIRNIHYENIQEALVLLHCNLKSKNNSVELRLKSLSLEFARTQPLDENCKVCGTERTPLASCLSNLCPEIESISVCFNDKDAPILKFFPKLTSFVYYCDGDISPGLGTIYYLNNYGAKLTSLKIYTNSFDSNLFLTIGKACTTLKELSVHCMFLVNNLNPEEEKNLKVFTDLLSFSLKVVSRRRDSIAPISILQLLKSTCSLTQLTFKCNSLMCDDERFKEFWNLINTQSLSSVSITSTNLELTMSTVRLILESCPLLKKLENLVYWDIDREELELLKSSLKKSNYDVEIICSLEASYQKVLKCFAF